jgi:hypothetical protein
MAPPTSPFPYHLCFMVALVRGRLTVFIIVFSPELILMSHFTLNCLIYYSSIITNRGLHVPCYTTPVFSACQIFNFYYYFNFCTHMTQVINSYFAKYLRDIYSEYITPRDSDLCHDRCYTSHASTAMHPTLGDYGPVQLSR